eukprot:PhM_4_TR75/c0_g2_i1/m.42115
MSARRVIVFSGQGSQVKGMGCQLLQSIPRTSAFAKTWRRADDYMRDTYNVDLTTIIRDNPANILSAATPLNPTAKTTISHPNGVLQYTPFTQVALVTYQISLLNELVERCPDKAYLSSAVAFAGHSIGEFSALVAAGTLPLEAVLDLVYHRGFMMDRAVTRNGKGKSPYALYVASPKRAQLSEELFLAAVEALSKPAAEAGQILEVVGYNVVEQNYTVAGTMTALATLGKLLDPQWRVKDSETGGEGDLASIVWRALKESQTDEVKLPPLQAKYDQERKNETRVFGSKKFIKRANLGPLAALRKRDASLGDIAFLPPDVMSAELTREGIGQSGLRKRPWWIPLPIDIPFHSSVLRRTSDDFNKHLGKVLADHTTDDTVRQTLSRRFVPNLTGRLFDVSDDASTELTRGHIHTWLNFENIGEQWHPGRHGYPREPTPLPDATPRALLQAALSGQFVAAVQWIDVMECLVSDVGVGEVLECAPTPTLGEMFRKHVAAAAADVAAADPAAVTPSLEVVQAKELIE